MPTQASLLRRFKDVLKSYDSVLNTRIAVALSGGVDSAALLDLLVNAKPDDNAILALTVDHQYRPESGQEASAIAKHVSQRYQGVAHEVLKIDWSPYTGQAGLPPRKAVFESTARLARYRLLSRACNHYGVKFLFVAHHKDDQAETGLMRLSRESGVEGLAGMRAIGNLPLDDPSRRQIRIIRPLLDFSKAELKAYCEQQGIQWFEDPTNVDTDHQRNLVRAFLHGVNHDSSTACTSDGITDLMKSMRRHTDVIEHKVGELAKNNIFLPKDELKTVLLVIPDNVSTALLRRLLLHALTHLNVHNTIRLEVQLNAVQQLTTSHTAFTMAGCHLKKVLPSIRQLKRVREQFGNLAAAKVSDGNVWHIGPQRPKRDIWKQ